MQHKLLLILPTILLVASSCTKQIDTTKPYKVSSNAEWVQELAKKNPLKDSANYTSVVSFILLTFQNMVGTLTKMVCISTFTPLIQAKNIVIQLGIIHVDVFHRIL